jgi:two-component system sensor histidine kinase UhpB
MSVEPPTDLKVLLLEDDPNDAELVQIELGREMPHLRWQHVTTEAAFRAALDRAPDLVLADYSLPGFDGLRALAILRERHADVPFIFVSGSLGEERATEALKSGATDYVLKDRLHRLPAVVRRALAEARERDELRKAQSDLDGQRLLLGTLIDNLPVVVFAVDREQRLTVVNSEFLKLIGRSRSAVIGEPRSAFPELDRLLSADIARPGSVRGRRDYHEVAWENPDGTFRWFMTSEIPLRDPAGDIVGTLSTSREITAFRELTHELLEVSNREQQRLGSDLHDGLGQDLTGLSLLLRGLEVQLALEAPPYVPQVTRIRELVAGAIQSTRLLARGLAPVNLERGGLPEALRNLAELCRETYGIDCTFRLVGGELPKLHEGAATHLFRIAQEATTNAARYARATRLSIELQASARRLKLTVTDNGIGLSAGLRDSQPGMGLKIMEYRARMLGATLTFEEPDIGTRVTVSCSLLLLLPSHKAHRKPDKARSPRTP